MRVTHDYGPGGTIRSVQMHTDSSDTVVARVQDQHATISVEPPEMLMQEPLAWAMLRLPIDQLRSLALQMLACTGVATSPTNLDTFEGTRTDVVNALLSLAGKLAAADTDSAFRDELSHWWQVRGLPLQEKIVTSRRDAMQITRPALVDA